MAKERTNMESPTPPWVREVIEELRRLRESIDRSSDRYSNWQRQTAEAVTDLARGLTSSETQSRARHAELLGVLLALDAAAESTKKAPAGGKELAKKEHEDPSGIQVLPDGTVVATATPKRYGYWILRVVRWIALAGGGYGMHWFGTRK